MATLSKLPQRPSDILGIKGSELDKILWDAALLKELPQLESIPLPKGVKVPGMSTKDQILRKRKRSGIRSMYT